jgi:DNA-binding transcriptional ArsR family regulator
VAAPLEITDAERLRIQAHALECRARALKAEADGLKAEAVELRTDADRLEREPVRPRRRDATAHARGRLSLVTADPDFQGRVCATLAHSEGLSSHALAEHLGASQGRVRAALKRLEEAGKVVRTGATRRTRWFLAGEPEPEPARTGVARLHVFTKTMDRRELEDRELAYTTEAPAVVGELPERDA